MTYGYYLGYKAAEKKQKVKERQEKEKEKQKQKERREGERGEGEIQVCCYSFRIVKDSIFLIFSLFFSFYVSSSFFLCPSPKAGSP